MTDRINPPVPLAEQDFWRRDAACAWAIADNEVLTNAWVDEDDEYAPLAQNVCMTCPVRQNCILDAVRDQESEGLRGGFYFQAGGVPSADGAKIRREFGVRVRTRQKPKANRYARDGMFSFVDYDHVVPRVLGADL